MTAIVHLPLIGWFDWVFTIEPTGRARTTAGVNGATKVALAHQIMGGGPHTLIGLAA